MLIEDYFVHLEKLLAACPYIAEVTLTKEKRAPHIGFVKGEIVFVGGIRLFVMEFVREVNICLSPIVTLTTSMS